MKFLRYDEIATPIEDDKLKKQVLIDSPGIAKIYDENSWETGMFYLEMVIVKSETPCILLKNLIFKKRI